MGCPWRRSAQSARSRKPFLTKADLIELISRSQADPGLTDDLARLAGETTEDLDPL